MAYTWTARQFVGGTVALDFANTVCFRGDPARSFDKIEGSPALADFAEAALAFSDLSGRDLRLPGRDDDPLRLALYRRIRESADALFRPVKDGSASSASAYRAVMQLHCDLLSEERIIVGPEGVALDPAGRPSFAVALTQSAVRLAHSPELARLKLCPNCRWLFIDRSRNASRTWCDMLTCGNRAKARRHHERRRVRADTETADSDIGG